MDVPIGAAAALAGLSPPMNWPKCVITDVHDGDTVGIDIDLGRYERGPEGKTLGFHVYIESNHLHIHQSVRLYGLNAPELSTPAGKVAHDALIAYMPVGSQVGLTTWLDRNDKYGRILGVVTYHGILNDWLILNGYAVVWDGKGPKP